MEELFCAVVVAVVCVSIPASAISLYPNSESVTRAPKDEEEGFVEELDSVSS